MRFGDFIDLFIEDKRLEGRMKPTSERSYRGTLYKHADDVNNRDPRKTGPEDVKRTLARWPNPSSRSICQAHLRSFYRWMIEEGYRDTNPVDKTRRPKRRKPDTYRLSTDEVRRL